MTDRVKIVLVDPGVILALLNWHRYECLTLPVIKELPEGATAKAVHYSPSRRCFELLVHHPSFPTVPMGHEAPLFHEEFVERQLVKLERVADGMYGHPTLKTAWTDY